MEFGQPVIIETERWLVLEVIRNTVHLNYHIIV